MARSLWRFWPAFKKRIPSSGKVLLLLDFDGTLSPLVRIPFQAKMPQNIGRILHKLSMHSRVRLCIMSGRGLADVRKRVKLRSAIYGGTHGLEIQGPGISFQHPQVRAFLPLLKKWKLNFAQKLKKISGSFLEDKKYSFVLHSRRIPKKHLVSFEKQIREFKKETRREKIQWKTGHCVYEIFPKISWDKGKASKSLLKKLKGFFPIAIGDDRTDEDMFKAIAPKGLSVRVGDVPTKALFYIDSQREVPRFLKEVEKTLA